MLDARGEFVYKVVNAAFLVFVGFGFQLNAGRFAKAANGEIVNLQFKAEGDERVAAVSCFGQDLLHKFNAAICAANANDDKLGRPGWLEIQFGR